MTKYRVTREPVVQPQDQSIRLIPLTRGKVTVVDAADYDWLMQWNWYAFKTRDGYYAARTSEERRMVLMHRALVNEESEETDHKDGDTLNNRRLNLRPCTRSQNQANRKKDKRNKSGYKGVSWSKSNEYWQAQTSVGGRHIHLGFFKTPEEAHAAYCAFSVKTKGEFAHF